MVNENFDNFMSAFTNEALTFDDVSLVTQYADFLPSESDTRTYFSKNISLNIPFISAAMDTVTESQMAIAMAQSGGIGVIHKNLSVRKQADEIRKVKTYLHGLIRNPVLFHPEQTIGDILKEKEKKKYNFSGFPIVDEAGILLGMISKRDLKFISDKKSKIADVMVKSLVTAPEGTPLTKAFEIMKNNKLGKLPLVTSKGKLVGLYSYEDVKSIIENVNPLYTRDNEHCLRTAAAAGPYDYERIEALIDARCDAIVIDTAHGHSKGVIETIKECKKKYPHIDIVAGNIGTEEGAKAVLKVGADAVKVGIGPGSICTTRVVTGVGIPQITAIYLAAKAVGDAIPIIADGGIKQSGDVAKAIGAGASSVMMGSILAATHESPGEKISHKGKTYVIYRGMGSLEAMKSSAGSRERYGVKEETLNNLVPQGVEGMVLFKGSVKDVLTQYIGGLKYSLGYCGTRTIGELRKNARFVKVTSAGLREAHPHDIEVTKDAPNYSVE
jgi:IMP dehydrogenase